MIAQATVQYLPVPDNSIDLIFTDPPYSLDYLNCYGWLAKESKRVLKPNGFVLVLCGGLGLNKIFQYFDEAGLEYYWKYENGMTDESGVVWKFSSDGKTSKPIFIRSKPILVYSKGKSLSYKGTSSFYNGEGKNKTYHDWAADAGTTSHFIDCFSKEGDLVLDPFMGGGTTKIVCEILNRKCITFDIDTNAIETTKNRVRGITPEMKIPQIIKGMPVLF